MTSIKYNRYRTQEYDKHKDMIYDKHKDMINDKHKDMINVEYRCKCKIYNTKYKNNNNIKIILDKVK